MNFSGSFFEQDNLVGGDGILTVSQLSLLLKKTVEVNFNNVKLRGEISGLKVHSSGHQYFTIKDQEAVMDAIIWRGTPIKVRLQDGMEVIANGKLTTYPGRSKYQMIVSSAEVAGEGELLRLLIQLKKKLQEEGLFNRKRLLPSFPNVIGVVTSPTGAVIRDILHRITDRYPCCQVLVYPVAVQGYGAAEQIAKAINDLNHFLLKPDVLIVARGGGSLEDLWAFNEEIVVRAVYNSQIPVIAAVGHETDTTLIDYAADLRAPTPTAAAEFATPELLAITQFLLERQQRLIIHMGRDLETIKLKLANLVNNLPNLQQLINDKMQKVDDWSERLFLIFTNYFSYRKNLLSQYRLTFPYHLIEKKQDQLTNLSEKLFLAWQNHLRNLQQKLDWHNMMIEQNSYQRTLEKGFCIISDNNSIINSKERLTNLSPSTINLQFFDGTVQLKVREEI